jgi:hypothetical protein
VGAAYSVRLVNAGSTPQSGRVELAEGGACRGGWLRVTGTSAWSSPPRDIQTSQHPDEWNLKTISKVDLELQYPATRLGGASAALSALRGLVVNLIHGDLPTDAALTRVATTTSWGRLHLGIMASTVFDLGGLVGPSGVANGSRSRAFARLGLMMALPGSAAVMLVGIAIDGFATKTLADLWASAPPSDQAAALGRAVTVLAIQRFHAWSALFIGLPFVLLGISGLLGGGGFPRWLGLVTLVGGAGAFFMRVAGFLNVPVVQWWPCVGAWARKPSPD